MAESTNNKRRFNFITNSVILNKVEDNFSNLSSLINKLNVIDKNGQQIIKKKCCHNNNLGKKIFYLNKSINYYCYHLNVLFVVLLIIQTTYFIPITKASTSNELNNDLSSPSSSSSSSNTDGFDSPSSSASNEVGPCEACQLVVKSFEKGMDETSRGKHEGGDTSWEEKNLKNYADSEIRLVEIQERLCEEVKKGKAQCLSLVEDNESEIEDWWFNQRNKNVRLNDYLCISKLKRCCASGRFGPNCQACPSNCNQHGLCDGDGTRLGTGKCNCDPGYVNDECDDCADDHFRIATNDEKHFTCRECDLSCNGCFGPGPLNCTQCRQGYYKHETNGCIDINECDMGFNEHGGESKLCKGNTYCENTNGGFKCIDCHISCNGCVGYGSNMCLSCAPGYQLDEEYSCKTRDEIEQQERWEEDEAIKQGKGTLARLFFYLGILASSMMMFGFRSNLYVMYTFLIGFIVFLVLSELELLDEIQDYTLMSSE